MCSDNGERGGALVQGREGGGCSAQDQEGGGSAQGGGGGSVGRREELILLFRAEIPTKIIMSSGKCAKNLN